MLVVHIFVQESTVISKSCEIPKHIAAMLTLVDLVPPVSLYVCPKVVPACVPSPTNMTSEWLLSCVDSHVPTKMGRPDELSTAHLAWIGAFRLWDWCTITILLRCLVDDAHGGISGRSGCSELVDSHDGCLQQGEVPTDILKRVHLYLSIDDCGGAIWCGHGS